MRSISGWTSLISFLGRTCTAHWSESLEVDNKLATSTHGGRYMKRTRRCFDRAIKISMVFELDYVKPLAQIAHMKDLGPGLLLGRVPAAQSCDSLLVPGVLPVWPPVGMLHAAIRPRFLGSGRSGDWMHALSKQFGFYQPLSLAPTLFILAD